jgi:hypothetical protein
MSENNNFCYNVCCYNIYNRIFGLIAGLFNVYVKNILLYYDPLEIKIAFNVNKQKLKTYNRLKKYNTNDNPNKYNFIYKIHKVDQKNGKFYNFGYYYHTSNKNINIFKEEKQIAYPPENIQSVLITLQNNSKKLIINDCIKHNFINNILSNASIDSNLSILIYYYLQKYLNNYDKINKVELELNNRKFLVKHNDNLNNIYNDLDKKLDNESDNDSENESDNESDNDSENESDNETVNYLYNEIANDSDRDIENEINKKIIKSIPNFK